MEGDAVDRVEAGARLLQAVPRALDSGTSRHAFFGENRSSCAAATMRPSSISAASTVMIEGRKTEECARVGAGLGRREDRVDERRQHRALGSDDEHADEEGGRPSGSSQNFLRTRRNDQSSATMPIGNVELLPHRAFQRRRARFIAARRRIASTPHRIARRAISSRHRSVRPQKKTPAISTGLVMRLRSRPSFVQATFNGRSSGGLTSATPPARRRR